MKGVDFDPRLTFDTFVVGPANRLASAAARRAAEAPGTSYNPLFLYSASGLGKSHTLSAMAHHFLKLRPGGVVVYQTLEGYLDELARALGKGGGQDAMRERYLDLDVLLLDDVQFLTGQTQAQEMLLRTLDALTARGAQVVLASDRPPSEINGLDARLLSRFSGGLIVDIGPPDYETRVAIMRRKAEDRGMTLSPGVAEGMARYPAKNIRELQGALNRLLATQELEGRPVTIEELPGILGEVGGTSASARGALAASAPSAPLQPSSPPAEPEWRRRIREVARAADQDGFAAARILRLLEGAEPAGWDTLIAEFERDIARAREMRAELDRLGNPWPEAAATLLRDPDRLEEAENLLASARERAAPFPALPNGPVLADLMGVYPPLALRAAARLVEAERPDYNPLYVHSSEVGRACSLLEAAGRTFLAGTPAGRVAFISVAEFSEDFIRAISDGVAGAWRERWWSVELLLLHGIEGLSLTERAQDEFFHLFEALIRRGAKILIAADRPPSRIEGVDDRIRSRFEGGLVLDVGSEPDSAPASESAIAAPTIDPVARPVADREPALASESAIAAPTSDPIAPPVADREPTSGSESAIAAPTIDPIVPPVGDREPVPAPESAIAAPATPTSPEDDLNALREMAGVPKGRPRGGIVESEDLVIVAYPPAPLAPELGSGWFPSPEKAVWEWPSLEDRLVEAEE